MSKSEYLCEYCDKAFKSTATLKVHMKQYNEQEVGNERYHNLETLRELESDNLANLSSLCISSSEFVSTGIKTRSENKYKYSGKIFCKGNNPGRHMIKMHKPPENCVPCYGCYEDISDFLAIALL